MRLRERASGERAALCRGAGATGRHATPMRRTVGVDVVQLVLLLELAVALLELLLHDLGAPLLHRLLVRHERELEHVRFLLEQPLVFLRHLERLLQFVGLRVALERGKPPLRLLLLQLLLYCAKLLERLRQLTLQLAVVRRARGRGRRGRSCARGPLRSGGCAALSLLA